MIGKIRHNLFWVIIPVIMIFVIDAERAGITEGINLALIISGHNYGEISKALGHYEKNSEKYRAMLYTVSSIIGKTSETKDANSVILRYMNNDSVSTAQNIYNIIAKNKLLIHNQIDLQVIDSEYLISNVEDAYDVWQSSKWKDNVSFEMFCEYILPYNIDTEPVVYWRKNLREKYYPLIKNAETIEEAYELVCDHQLKNRSGHKLEYPYKQDIRIMEKVNDGDCEQRAKHIVYILRALGIPAAVDYITKWANYGNNSHKWAALVKSKDSTYVISEGLAGNIEGVYEKSKYYYNREDYPYSVDSLKKIAKIFRNMWGNPDLTDGLIGVHNDYKGRIDVTATYEKKCIKDVRIKLFQNIKTQPYLCIFNQVDGWIPINKVKEIRQDEVATGAIFDECVIAIGEYVDDAFYVISNPHIVSRKGVHELLPDSKHMRSVVLRRKYLLLNRWLNRWGAAMGTRIETSDCRDFSLGCHVISTIDTFPKEVIRLNLRGDLHRFLRIFPKNGEFPVFSEIRLFDKMNNEILSDRFKVYACGGNLDNDPEVTNSLIDRQESTTFFKLFPFWIGIDILECKDELRAIELTLWNDENRVKTGCIYELFYFRDGEWLSLGNKVAEGDCLIYENVPDNALMWLRNYSEGVEERVFIYRNDKQIWW